jgi:O-antigen ligase
MSRLKEAVLPAFLLLCLLLGGSSQAIWGNALLQLLALGILAWAALAPEARPISADGRRLLLLIAAALLLIFAQLVPLPPAVWASLPGRDFIAEGFRLLGVPLPWLPISQAPYDTMTTALTLLPPLALVVGMLRLPYWRTSWMFAAIVAATAISIVLGVLQVSSGNADWYFYRWTNLGVAVGTFANGNHFATLLLAAVPAIAALAIPLRGNKPKHGWQWVSVTSAIAAAFLLVVGLVINGSMAMFVIGPAVAAATAMMVVRLSPRRRRQGLVLAVGLLAAAGAVLVVAGRAMPGGGMGASIETRQEYWRVSLGAMKDQWLTGSGFGTFVQTYHRYEDPALADRWFANHAHNDYLELVLEGGLPAALLLAVFLLWWLGRARHAWGMDSAAVEQRAAAIASAAILVHSLFDFPLRTAGISALFAVCLALLAGAAGAASRKFDDRDRVRHATL